MEWWTGKSGNDIEFWLKNKHLEEICWWGYLIYRTKIPQCYTFWKDKMIIFMHAAHVFFSLLTHGEFLKLASAVTWQSNGSDFFTGHNGRLTSQPPKRPFPSVRIEIRVTQLLYSALWSWKNSTLQWAWKNSLCCTAGHTFLSSWLFGVS